MSDRNLLVKGAAIDSETRCIHYHSKKDIIAIKFYCCQTYFPCYACHSSVADHETILWPKSQFSKKAILCGACKKELTILEYMDCQSVCPHCSAKFNPGCSLHAHLYFES